MGLKLDEKFMKIALDEALSGIPYASPNPYVGCAIVKQGKLISKGAHRKFGSEHAEIAALNRAGDSAKNATLYVNLEPCSHYGKTGPCVDAIIAAGIKRVVVAMRDPNVLVNGNGLAKLKEAGISVDIGVLADESHLLNERYKKWIKTRVPFVYVKSALTIDGSLTFKLGTESHLSSPESTSRVHQLRSEYDAVAIGIDTLLIDDPKLTSRLKSFSRNPIRVIFDTHLRCSMDADMLDEDGVTWIFTGLGIDESRKRSFESKFENVKILPTKVDSFGNVSLVDALKYLGQNNVSSLLVEGGSKIIGSFFNQKLVDKLSLIYTPKIATEMHAAPKFFSDDFASGFKIVDPSWELVGSDAWFNCYPEFS